MLPADPFTPPPADAVVVGAGRLTLDVIVREAADQGEVAPPRSQAGGTCGNVLTNLAYLGWHSYPLMDLGDDDPGRRFTNDLSRWGVHLDLIRQSPTEQTPVIIHHIRYTGEGAVHSFSSRCPFCNQRLRYFEPVPVEGVRSACPPSPSRAFSSSIGIRRVRCCWPGTAPNAGRWSSMSRITRARKRIFRRRCKRRTS